MKTTRLSISKIKNANTMKYVLYSQIIDHKNISIVFFLNIADSNPTIIYELWVSNIFIYREYSLKKITTKYNYAATRLLNHLPIKP